MDVSCPSCSARYTADDEKLRGKTARMRCKACNTVWLVSGPGAPSAVLQGAIASVPPAAISSVTPMPKIEDSPSKVAAVVKTGKEREKRDLFAAQDADAGGVKQTLLPPAASNGVGARNENSVLFRVDQLSGAPRSVAPAPVTPAPAARLDAPRDEEGVIDLKALSSAPPALRPVALPVAPLFSEPPPMTLEVDDNYGSSAGKPTSKLRWVGMAAAAAAFLVVAGFGISVAFKGEEPVKHTPMAIAAAPPPPAETAPPPAKTAEPAPTADAQDSAPKAKKGKKGKKAPGVITKDSPIPAAKAPVKPADPCGCHGDLNCILACTVAKK